MTIWVRWYTLFKLKSSFILENIAFPNRRTSFIRKHHRPQDDTAILRPLMVSKRPRCANQLKYWMYYVDCGLICVLNPFGFRIIQRLADNRSRPKISAIQVGKMNVITVMFNAPWKKSWSENATLCMRFLRHRKKKKKRWRNFGEQGVLEECHHSIKVFEKRKLEIK